jgi:hypothetical protein
MVEADVVDLVRRVRTRVEGRGDYPREITQGISEEIGERPDRPVAGPPIDPIEIFLIGKRP